MLYLLVLDDFVLGLVFRITHSVYIPLLLLESDLGLLWGLRWCGTPGSAFFKYNYTLGQTLPVYQLPVFVQITLLIYL